MAQLRKELHKRQVRHTGLYKEDSKMLQDLYDTEYAVRYLQRERDEDASYLGMEADEEDEARNELFGGELGPASAIWKLPNLRTLSLCDNGISNRGAIALADVLTQSVQIALSVLRPRVRRASELGSRPRRRRKIKTRPA